LLCTLSKNPEYLGNVRLRERRLSLINPLVKHRMNYSSLQNLAVVKTPIFEKGGKKKILVQTLVQNPKDDANLIFFLRNVQKNFYLL
jgi:hypothetical protein